MMLRRIIKALVPSGLRRRFRPALESLSLVAPIEPRHIDDILVSPYKRIGILNCETDELSGETYLLERVIPTLVKAPQPILFDVGANIGDYTLRLIKAFPTATVYAFEPSSETYSKLIGNVSDSRVRFVQKGLSDSVGFAEFFDYGEKASSSHGSLFSEVITVLHHSDSTKSFKVELTTIDDYCKSQQIEMIDFIKIDTEGNELSVLKGARGLISAGGLSIIQFEFNEMNVISRSFLKDFYGLLEGYSFFRLMPNGLLPLGAYNSRNEIFAFQNILAIRSDSIASSRIAPFLVPLK